MTDHHPVALKSARSPSSVYQLSPAVKDFLAGKPYGRFSLPQIIRVNTCVMQVLLGVWLG